MIKLILLVVAFVALIQPSVQIKCYNCKSQDIHSTYEEANKLRLCDKDIDKSDTVQSLDFKMMCKKLVEKVKVNDKEEHLIIRTMGIEKLELDGSKFEEYSCSEDLCNTAANTRVPIFLSVLAASIALLYNW